MRRQVWSAAVVAVVGSTNAAAVNTEKHEIPYFGVAGEYLVTDEVRDADAGAGVHFTLGIPFGAGRSAVEMRFFDAGFERFDGKKDYQTGLMFDYVHDFGPLDPRDPSFLGGIKPFVTVGLGFLEEDVRADKHVHLGLSAGAGVLVPLPILFKGWALRLDARVQPQSNDESCPGPEVCTEEASVLVDYQVNLGVQIPLTLFFDRPVDVPPAEDCPVAVVDPATGRRDCIADSDNDGVADARDRCPGTPSGTMVDRTGCGKTPASTDDDGDGVTNEDDDCPDTPQGLKVDREGCVVAQKTAISGVTFQPNSAKLTTQGRTTLDGVASTLKQQEDLAVEIAGHTDAVGSEAYNTLLSQQRADAVRAYLVGKGIDEDRMTAVGYGELEPVASNDTEEGRRANRRVEFRITTD